MLIALHSRGQQAGKDTAAEFIHEWCDDMGLTFQRLAFADKGKLLVAEALGLRADTDAETIARVDRFKLEGGLHFDQGRVVGSALMDDPVWISGRDFIINLLGVIGAEEPGGARRLFGERFWTDATLPEDWLSLADTTRPHVTVVTDLRSEEEAERVRFLCGWIVEVANPRAIDPGGRSEKGLPVTASYVLHNGGSLDEYREIVRAMMGRLATVGISERERAFHRGQPPYDAGESGERE